MRPRLPLTPLLTTPAHCLLAGLLVVVLLTGSACRKKAVVATPSAVPEREERPVRIQPPGLEARFEPETFNPEEGTWLIWESSGAQTVTIAPDIGEVLPSGRIQLFPKEDAVYQLAATGPGGVSRADARAVLRTRSTVETGTDSDVPIEEQFQLYFTPIHFELRSTQLDETARKDLDRALEWLKAPSNHQVRFLIQGHCDQRNSDEYGLALSDQRASLVRAYLLAGGLEESRVEAIPLGAEVDLAEADTPEEHARNRRADFVLITKKD